MASVDSAGIRAIEAEAPPNRYARGWHCLGLAASFCDGKRHWVRAFGTKLVVFADGTGALHVLDGYFRHMGGDLSIGTIKGDKVELDTECPHQFWQQEVAENLARQGGVHVNPTAQRHGQAVTSGRNDTVVTQG